jgi:hypothetical protein
MLPLPESRLRLVGRRSLSRHSRSRDEKMSRDCCCCCCFSAANSEVACNTKMEIESSIKGCCELPCRKTRNDNRSSRVYRDKATFQHMRICIISMFDSKIFRQEVRKSDTEGGGRKKGQPQAGYPWYINAAYMR